MATKNIGGASADKYYRYKRPELKTKVEKPGTNGVKTVIENMKEIAKSLKVPPAYPTQYLSYALCSGATYQESADRTVAIVKGNHTVKTLDAHLDDFIKKFVLCPKCKLPETKISVKKNQVRVKCASCGHAGPLNSGHKLENFIVKNPPVRKKTEFEGEKDEKVESDEKDDVDGHGAGEAPDDWSLDTSEDAVRKRRQEFLKDQQKQAVTLVEVDTSKPENVLKQFLAEKDRSVVAISSELDRLQLKHGLSKEERLHVLLTAAIDVTSPSTLGRQFVARAPILKKHATDQVSSVLLIQSIERLLQTGSSAPATTSKSSSSSSEKPTEEKIDLIPKIAMILQKLFEEEVLSEAAILSWAESPPDASTWAVGRDVAALTRKHAKPLVEWLKTAEEEEE